jgi:uncharacterized protein with von Willebrand factor type A (vWA) domain
MSDDGVHWTRDADVPTPPKEYALKDAEESMVDVRKQYVRIPMGLHMLEETMMMLNERASQSTVRYDAGDWVIEVG